MSLIIACATDDGVNFINRHFGDADYYYIYRLDENGSEFVKKIANTTEEEETHADPKKAGGIVQILMQENVKAGVAKVFGPNIKRIKKHFVPVLVHSDTIQEGLNELLNSYTEILNLWNQGETRRHLVLK
ncbi:MAG: hypothetical protein PWR10_1043 [Halanaerobiales bacterium]|nr:hypothetical protein [Halanaerobiales bacterium]